MLRTYFVERWSNLADATCEDALLDSTALRSFVGIDLARERVPDATMLLKFRRLLEKHKLGESFVAEVGQLLQAHGLKVGTGTIVDATINNETFDDVKTKQPRFIEEIYNAGATAFRARLPVTAEIRTPTRSAGGLGLTPPPCTASGAHSTGGSVFVSADRPPPGTARSV